MSHHHDLPFEPWNHSILNGVEFVIRHRIPSVPELPQISENSTKNYTYSFCKEKAVLAEHNVNIAGSSTQPTILNANHETVLEPLRSVSVVAQPPAAPASKNQQDGSFIRDFDSNGDDDPFDRVERQAINDMQELAAILRPNIQPSSSSSSIYRPTNFPASAVPSERNAIDSTLTAYSGAPISFPRIKSVDPCSSSEEKDVDSSWVVLNKTSIFETPRTAPPSSATNQQGPANDAVQDLVAKAKELGIPARRAELFAELCRGCKDPTLLAVETYIHNLSNVNVLVDEYDVEETLAAESVLFCPTDLNQSWRFAKLAAEMIQFGFSLEAIKTCARPLRKNLNRDLLVKALMDAADGPSSSGKKYPR